MNVSAARRIVSAISFGVFWRLRAFDHRNHSVQKTVRPSPCVTRMTIRSLDDAGAAGDRAAVAAALADHRRRFAGDRGFIHARDSLDDSPSAGMMSPASQTTRSPFCKIGRGNFFLAAVLQATRHRVLARPAQTGGLRFAPAFRHCFSKICEEHREPEPDRQLRDEAAQCDSAVKIRPSSARRRPSSRT